MKIKIFLVILSLALVFCVTSTALAMTETERQALIAQLQVQVTQLTQQINQIIAERQGTQTWCYTFNNNLGYANSGTNEVVNLHLALQKEGISYSPDDINTYSSGTSQAVIAFQEKYAYEILTPLGLSRGTGFTGNSTRTKLNQLYGCVSNTTPPTIPPTTCTPNWQTGSWSTCANNQQTRTVTDYNYCGTTTNKPATSQYCTSALTCTPNWQTGA